MGIFQQEISLVSTEQLLSHWTYICGKLKNSCFRDQALFTKHLSKCKNDWFQTSVILTSVQSFVFFSLVEQDQDGQRQKDDKTAEDYTQLSCKSDLTSQSNLLKTFMIHRLSHSAKLNTLGIQQMTFKTFTHELCYFWQSLLESNRYLIKQQDAANLRPPSTQSSIPELRSVKAGNNSVLNMLGYSSCFQSFVLFS